MKIGFIVNDIMTEEAGYTTTRLSMVSINRGHNVWIIGLGDLAYDLDEKVHARARSLPGKKYKYTDTYIKDLKGKKAIYERVNVSDLDVLMLRNDPSTDTGTKAWMQQAGIIFGRAAMWGGVIVLNDPNGLAKAMNKMYFQTFPEEVRPKTIITRDRGEIKHFFKEFGTIVIKPLQGSGGQSVFLVRPEDYPNINQMIDAVASSGYVIAQEYLKSAELGDTRLFMLNGQPLRYKGKYAAFKRVRKEGDMRSNVHAGGSIAQAEINDTMLRIAEIVRPKLVQDGMFMVGLDIVGDKLMEINVFSPGGLGSAQKFEGVNFTHAVIAAIERKVEYMKYYRRNFDNREMATL